MNTTTTMTQVPITKQMIIHSFEEEMDRQYHELIETITNVAADGKWFYNCDPLTYRMTKLLVDNGFHVVHTELDSGEYECTVFGWSDFKYEHGHNNDCPWDTPASDPPNKQMKTLRDIYVMACTELANSMKYHAFLAAAEGNHECFFHEDMCGFTEIQSIPSRIHMCLSEAGIELCDAIGIKTGVYGFGWDNG